MNNKSCSSCPTLLLVVILSSVGHIIASQNNDTADLVSPAKELNTTKDLDFKSHKYFSLLPSFNIDICGKSDLGPLRPKRLVGGHASIAGKHPWVVHMYNRHMKNGTFSIFCGGTIIHPKYILTAAHCVTRSTPGTNLSPVVIGVVDRREMKLCEHEYDNNCSVENHRDIQELIVHENYSEGNLQHDIALIRLFKEIPVTNMTRPICLPFSEKILEKWITPEVTTIGWGIQNKHDSRVPKMVSDVQQEVTITLRQKELCDRYLTRFYGKSDSTKFCAGADPGKGNCHGDSGGPVLKELPIDHLGQPVVRNFQFGIVSTGLTNICGWEGRPSFYPNVLYYIPWILDQIGKREWKNSTNATEQSLNRDDSSEDNEINESNSTPKDVSETYLTEFSTGSNVDISGDSNLHKLPKPSECGRSSEDHTGSSNPKRVKRVIGGHPAGIGTFPWMVQLFAQDSLTENKVLFCGGTVISKRHVLTAAHCVNQLEPPYTFDSLILGGYHKNQAEECVGDFCSRSQLAPIENITIHPDFTKFTRHHDIAVVRLARNLTFNKLLRPICLPTMESELEKMKDPKVILAGWGKISENGEESAWPNILQQIAVDVVPRNSCDAVLTRLIGNLERTRLCVGGEAEKGVCKGDSGGPLMKVMKVNNEGKQKYYQLGIGSFTNCGQQGIPSVYTNLIHYMPWLLSVL